MISTPSGLPSEANFEDNQDFYRERARARTKGALVGFYSTDCTGKEIPGSSIWDKGKKSSIFHLPIYSIRGGYGVWRMSYCGQVFPSPDTPGLFIVSPAPGFG